MVFFQQQQQQYSSTVPATAGKYKEEPDWAPAPPPRRPDARNVSGANRGAPHEQRDASSGGLRMPIRNDRESQSYAAAINAVNEATNNEFSEDEAGKALHGLWRVFDAGIGELGAELNDSLSNKALFEACIYQETSDRQGKPISQAEKNADAASRRSIYQSNLRSTLLRLRGSFADVLLGASKDIQDSTNHRLQELETKVRASVQKDIQNDLQQDIQSKLNQEMGRIKEKAEMEIKKARSAADVRINKAEQMQHEANAEINRLNNEISMLKRQSDSEIDRLTRELQASKHNSDAEISRLHENIASIQHSRDDAVTKLSSTLETLQANCVTAQTTEKKLAESEGMLESAMSTQRDLRERVGFETERVMLLQKKLESESHSKQALVSMKAEIERHLSLERERADLLQQELDSQKKTQQEMQMNLLNAFGEEEKNMRGELENATLLNAQLREQLKNANEAGSLLNQKVEHIQPRLDQYTNALGKISDKCSKLEAALSEVQSDNVQLVQSLNDLKEENAKLESLLSQVNEEKEQLADALANAQSGIANLLGTVDQGKEEHSKLVALLNEMKDDNTQLADALNGMGSEKTQLADVLEEAHSKQSDLIKQLDKAKDQVEQRDSKISELSSNYEACEVALNAAKDDVNKLSSMLKSYKEDLDKKSELNSLLDAEVSRLETQVETLTTEKSDLSENLNVCKDHLEKSSEVNSLIAAKVAKLEATVEDQVLELQAAKLSEADVESSLAESMKKNEELTAKLNAAKHEVQTLTEKLRDECREKKQKIESLNDATQLLNDFERIIKELEERSKGKSDELEQLAQWNASLQSERDSLLKSIQLLEGTTIKDYEKTLKEKNELLNEMSEVVEALKEQILLVERDSSEKMNALELTTLEQAQEAEKEASDTILKLEHDLEQASKKMSEAVTQAEELQILNDCLETECDSLREKLSKCQEEYNSDRDKIAGALLGFDEEMTNAEAKIKSVLDELEAEKGRGKDLSTTLSKSKQHCDSLESQVKNLEAKCSDLELECKTKQDQVKSLEKKQADHGHELSVYQEAIKMLQEKVDGAYGPDATSKSDSSRPSTEIQRVKKQLDEAIAAQNDMAKNSKEEADALRAELSKEKNRLGRLQKLCFNARQDLKRLQEQKGFLETTLQRSIKFIKHLQQSSDNTDAHSTATNKIAISNFDQICLPMDTSLKQTGDGGAEELQVVFSYIENHMNCNEGGEESERLIASSHSW